VSRRIDRSDAAERESASSDARARATPTPGGGRDQVLALQRSAGNRAVGRWLSGGERRLARQRQTVRHGMRETGVVGQPDVAWTASYDVEFTDGECIVTVFAAFNRDADVTEAEENRMRRRARRAIMRIWDNRFELEDRDSGEVFPLRLRFIKVERRPHLTINVHSGNGTDNRVNWFIGSSATDHAHEFGHQIAMYDEYVDATVANRATAASPGIRTDHSIMGDYPNEGPLRARARLRHGQRLARHIGGRTGRRLRARYRTAAPSPAPAPAPAGP
jgi:hypothetical protein